MTKNINIYLVDDHSLFREGLSFLLSKLNFIDNIYEASSGEDFIEGLKEFQSSANHVKIDVVLIDIRMQGISGIEATKNSSFNGPRY
jgi:Response regulator containing a CheY-like receiver domain and an HTH DNA-binding domain